MFLLEWDHGIGSPLSDLLVYWQPDNGMAQIPPRIGVHTFNVGYSLDTLSDFQRLATIEQATSAAYQQNGDDTTTEDIKDILSDWSE